jgi:hypothetical protein
MDAAIDDLTRIRCDDPHATDAMRAIRLASRTLSETWLPRVHDILRSDVLTSYRPAGIDDRDVFRSAYSTAHDRGWEATTDPLPLGPATPRLRTFDEVLTHVCSGVLVPMTPPLDAHGRAGAHYTSLTFAATDPHLLGTADTTSDILKIVDVMSDGLPVGWHENSSLAAYYLTDARVTSAVHVLTAYERQDGPVTLLDFTTQATVSGYLVIRTDESVGDIDVGIGPGDQDPTQSVTIASQSTSMYSGMFFPDSTPAFHAVDPSPRFESSDLWTFTKSAAPMVDGWGTWEL